MATLDPWIYNRAAAMAYDNDNIFAKILRGEAPAFRVFEDEFSLAFMDVMPQVPGHTLVIPKDPTQDILNADPIILGHTMSTVQKVATAVKRAFGPGIVTARFCGSPPVRPFPLTAYFARTGGIDLQMHARGRRIC